MKNYLLVIREFEPHKYEVRLCYAIYLFLSSRNIVEAKREIKKAKNQRDSRWEFSLAFLLAYEGNLKKAHTAYQNAFRGAYPQGTPNDVEVFIQDILESESDKIQLWYCLGMINFFCKKDFRSSKRDFENFINTAEGQGAFLEQIDFAKKYLAEIEQRKEREN
jgi:hypothetical protein